MQAMGRRRAEEIRPLQRRKRPLRYLGRRECVGSERITFTYA